MSTLLIASKAFNWRNIKAATNKSALGSTCCNLGLMSLAMPPSSFDNLLAVRRCGTELDLVGSEAESQSDGRFSGQSGPSALAGPWRSVNRDPFQGDRSGARCSRKSPSALPLWTNVLSILAQSAGSAAVAVYRVLLMHRDVDRRRMQSMELHSGRPGLRSDSNDRVRPK